MELKLILLRRFYLADNGSQSNGRYYAAKLLNQFGILVDKPTRISKEHVQLISNFYGINIPNSFYSNPQDMNYFTCDELLLEQIVSYFSIECITGVASDDEASFNRIEIFKKALPNYKEGKEVNFRNYRVINKEEETEILKEITENLCSYTRKWSETEMEEFSWIFYENKYYTSSKVQSKDNNVECFLKFKNINFAKALDKKDVVKISIDMKGERATLVFTPEEKALLKIAVENCFDTKLTKKQAKYFNILSKHILGKKGKESNILSPFKEAKKLIDSGKVIEAAKVFASNGSLLQRNLVWLLSRANFLEAKKILDLVEVKNPLVTIQFLNGLLKNSEEPRQFSFTKFRRLKNHKETEYETTWRKSILSKENKELLKTVILSKVDDYYRSLPSLGKVFISDTFKKVALPLNTSACGSGLGILPTGSRLPITDDYLRTFCYWYDAFDIDTSVNFVKDDEDPVPLYWANHSQKLFGSSALSSGDDRSRNGSEYIDFKISELLSLGYHYGVYSLNGFCSTLEDGEIYCGYQNKKDLDTKTWSAKNMALKIQVYGKSRAYIGFAVDFRNKEVVIINQMLESGSHVITIRDYEAIKQYLDDDFLSLFNIHKIASLRGEIVNDPSLADVVFDDTYVPQLNQKAVKSTDIEKLVNLLI